MGRERWRRERELRVEEEHQSVEDIGTGTSQANHRQGRVRRLLTGTSCGSRLLHFLLLLPLMTVVTSLWESLEFLQCTVIGQKPDHPNPAKWGRDRHHRPELLPPSQTQVSVKGQEADP